MSQHRLTIPRGLPTASDLRIFRIFQHCGDAPLARLATFAREMGVGAGQVIFREGDGGDDFFVVFAGGVEGFRSTPVGDQPTGHARIGQMFGEVSFLDGRLRATTMTAAQSSVLLRFDGERVRRAIDEDHELAVALQRSFWYALAAKIRLANQRMTEIMTPGLSASREGAGVAGEAVDLKPGAKLDLFQESGLSAVELRLLATTLRAQHFPPEALLFVEGDRGESLYIVVDGQVRISRRMSGTGEETLAVLGRGEVFGEMALVDDQPRSADAHAHIEGCTVLSLSRQDIDEVFNLAPIAASQFLRLVCGLLCHRLRAMLEMLAAWRTLAGPAANPPSPE